jgi:hypothetical protein
MRCGQDAKIVVLALCGGVAGSAHLSPLVAQSGPQPEWIRQFGTSGTDHAFGLAPGAVQDVFIVGHTDGAMAGTSAGGFDAFIARYRKDGTRAWIRQFGTSSGDGLLAATAAPDGGVFAAGTTSGVLGNSSAGATDGFVVRYTSGGTRLWLRQFGWERHDYPRRMAPDGAGGVYIGGDSDAIGVGPPLVFLIRFDGDGIFQWSRRFGTTSTDAGRGVAEDGAGGVFIGGYTHGTMGAQHIGGADIFLARYNADGDRLWIRQFGTFQNDYANALAPGPGGSVYIGGTTQGPLGGPHAGSGDAWIARYDQTGARMWIRQFGTPQGDGVMELTPDSAGGVYVGGLTTGNLAAPNAGGEDAYLARFDQDGNHIWGLQLGTGGWDMLNSLAIRPGVGVYIAGYTSGTLGASALGGMDAWLASIPAMPPPCAANCDGNSIPPILNVDDFTCFINAFAEAALLPHEQQVGHYANCDGSTMEPALNIDDFGCFINRYALGCP